MSRMLLTNLLIFVILLTLLKDGFCWRRRRRRRRYCSPRNCQVSSWTTWGSCSTTCGSGTQTRTRVVTSSAHCGGSCSYPLRESRSCSGSPAKNCQVSRWSAWSSCSVMCGNRTQERNRTVTSSAICGGTCNYSLKETRNCSGSCSCPLYRFGNRCQYSYRSSCRRRRGYRCFKHRPLTNSQCFLRYRSRSLISVCPRTHFARLCYCRRRCHPSILFGGRMCICRCRGSGAACCAHRRFVIGK